MTYISIEFNDSEDVITKKFDNKSRALTWLQVYLVNHDKTKIARITCEEGK